MTIAQSIFLGIVEGITEFLPVSSTAHLLVAQRLLGILEPSEFFTVIVQLGAIAGLIWVEKNTILEILKEFYSKITTDRQGLVETRFAGIAIGSFPIVLVGFLVKDQISVLHTNFSLIAFMSVAIGMVLLVAQMVAGKMDKKVTPINLLVMGLFQVIALIPGTSRSGITAAGGMFQKMTLLQALEYSFLLSIPALLLAGVYEIVSVLKDPIDPSLLLQTMIGSVVAFGCAIISIEFLRRSVRTIGFLPFVLYRFAFALFILVAV